MNENVENAMEQYKKWVLLFFQENRNKQKLNKSFSSGVPQRDLLQVDCKSMFVPDVTLNDFKHVLNMLVDDNLLKRINHDNLDPTYTLTDDGHFYFMQNYGRLSAIENFYKKTFNGKNEAIKTIFGFVDKNYPGGDRTGMLSHIFIIILNNFQIFDALINILNPK